MIHYTDGWRARTERQTTYATGVTGFGFDHPLFSLGKDGTLTIGPGYSWDGGSGPAINSTSMLYASLPHDVLYQAMRMGMLPAECRPEVDLLFHRCCLEVMWRPRAWWCYRAVRWFAAKAATKDQIRKVKTAGPSVT